MDSEGVSLPIHVHIMMPWADLRRGDCCGRLEVISDGYYCKTFDFFVHKNCGEFSKYIEHPSHPGCTLQLESYRIWDCNLCGRNRDCKYFVQKLFCCETCDFVVDLYCAKYPPPEVIDNSETHHHKITLFRRIGFELEAYSKARD
ncbi:PREDICTED: uncharacterized protein LOC109126307 [Camelina sativa]|uniref:Uncharacterized protein LOC109126307 n=1 Tax=Camelina sativa TaxID=90675 RepID=A0ABM1QEW9_CAMSA|nr:PREDICTED: uncharacterized protein LOC109126307 [Camelina sativa]